MKAYYEVFEGRFNNWVCTFYIGGDKNYDAYGTNGTGCKLYSTEEKAKAAGKRYIKRMQKLGFEI